MKKYLLIAGVMVLAACEGGDVRQTLGLSRSAPDEFKVVSRPPLSVPPEFHLRPPQPGAAPLGVPDADEVAEDLVLGGGASGRGQRILDRLDDLPFDEDQTDVDFTFEAEGMSAPAAVSGVSSAEITPANSAADSTFLEKVGAANANPNIRGVLHEDHRVRPVEKVESSYALERWLGLDNEASVVDAKAEAERIRKAVDEGTPVNEGDVPTVESSEKSTLDKIF